MQKQNKLNPEALKAWFYTKSISALSEVPSHYFNALLALGLIDTELTEDELHHFALDALIAVYSQIADNLQIKLSELVEKPKLNLYEQVTYNRLYKDTELSKKFRNAAAAAKISGVIDNCIVGIYGDYMQRAAVFYSKPIATISDLDSIGGVGAEWL